ncbi:MAG: hypothetical protein ABJE47_18930 [bacterium]
MTPPIVDFIPTPDSLLRTPYLAFESAANILGVATTFFTNSAYVRGVVEETFGHWRSSHGTIEYDRTHVRIEIIVHDAIPDGGQPTPVHSMSTTDGRLFVHAATAFAVVDPARHESIAYVSPSFAAEREPFRVQLLEAITFALIAAFDRHPLHASAIVRGEHAVLFAGASGAGKSTLAYVAHSAGIAVLGEDRVWIQLEPQFRVWGHATGVRLSVEPGSANKVTVPLGASSNRPTVANRATLCVLERGEHASLDALDSGALTEALERQVAPGFDRFPERHQRVVRALTGGGGWRLTLSKDPRDALPFLDRLLSS